MIEKGIIKETYHESNEFVSPIFIKHKQDRRIRLIINLKKLNKYVKYEHFKMDNIKSVLNLVTPNCFMCTIDLKDANYSVKINEEFQCYLKFQWKGRLLKFTCYPNGLGPCPRRFTKVPCSDLRMRGIPNSAFIDDIFTKEDLTQSVNKMLKNIVTTFEQLGYVIHPIKSQLTPKQEVVSLGFIIN